MNVAVRYPSGRQAAAPASLDRTHTLARVEVLNDLASAETMWRRLEQMGGLATPYQRFDLMASWYRHVGVAEGVRPFIVAGFDPLGEPLFIWPLGRKQIGQLGTVSFLGGKHANFNLGLWRREFATALTADGLRDIFSRLPRDGEIVDLVTLFRQPPIWDGVANPFALLPRQTSVDGSAKISLPNASRNGSGDGVSSAMRSRLRTKERKLQRLPGYRYVRGAEAAEIDRLLDTFFEQKAVHMASLGITNVFASPGVAQFLREACHQRLPDGRPLIEIHALEGGGEVLALFGATIDEYRFSSMFNTYTLSEHSRHSPGLILLMHMIEDCAARGVRSFDIGVGRAQYKSFFCKEPEPLFDTFLPHTQRGRVAAPVVRAAYATGRFIKERPALWSAVQRLRRLRAR
jgi:CelD/BcsL family acetyltransferase involved in cellulose biosynthesis